MIDTSPLFELINQNENTDKLRLEIANAISLGLSHFRDNFGYWEKLHFAHAIAALAWNIRSNQQSSTSWLRLCVVSLDLAFTQKDKRSEHYIPRIDQIETITFDDLVADVRKLGAAA